MCSIYFDAINKMKISRFRETAKHHKITCTTEFVLPFFLQRLNLCSYKDNYVDLQNLKINRTLRGLVFFKTKTFSCTWKTFLCTLVQPENLYVVKKIDNMTWIRVNFKCLICVLYFFA